MSKRTIILIGVTIILIIVTYLSFKYDKDENIKNDFSEEENLTSKINTNENISEESANDISGPEPK
jgi:hypothetical protein